MVYKSSTAKYSGKTTTKYIIYKESHIHNYQGVKKRRTQIRVKRVYISGKLRSWSRGDFPNRMGNIVHGIKFTYVNPIPKGAGRGGAIKKMLVSKIVEIPRTASMVKVTGRKPKKLMKVD